MIVVLLSPVLEIFLRHDDPYEVNQKDHVKKQFAENEHKDQSLSQKV